MDNMEPKKVYSAIVAVQAALAKEGIAKDKTCTQGATYKFRGIDDVYNALAPLLAENRLCILPRMLKRESVERVSKSGGAVFYTTVEGEFDFVSAEDGSKHTVGPMYGEAMDSADKGTNKAMSAAYKYACFQAFCIPTEGDNDTENQTHEVKPAGAESHTKDPPPAGTLTAVQTSILRELGEYCKGDESEMDMLLKDLTKLEKNGTWVFLKLEQVRNPQYNTESWAKAFGVALGKLRAKVKAESGAAPNPLIARIDSALTTMHGDDESAKTSMVEGMLGKKEWRILDDKNLETLAFLLEQRVKETPP